MVDAAPPHSSSSQDASGRHQHQHQDVASSSYLSEPGGPGLLGLRTTRADQDSRHYDDRLRFHDHHGENVRLSGDGSVAYRKRSFANSIVFSNRPLRENEVFMVHIDRIESGWSGHMRVGLTKFDPSSHAVPLPMYALPDLNAVADSWVFAITRHPNRGSALGGTTTVHQEGASEPTTPTVVVPPLLEHLDEQDSPDDDWFEPEENSAIPRLSTDVGSRIGVFYSSCGDELRVHLVVNGEDQGPMARLDRRTEASLFAVVDVYGTTKQVRVVPLRHSVQPLQRLCKSKVLLSLANRADIRCLPLPVKIVNYLKSDSCLHPQSIFTWNKETNGEI